MSPSNWIRAGLATLLLLGAFSSAAHAHKSKREARLPVIGAAPAFVLSSHRGGEVSLRDLAGKPMVLTFLYTGCKDACPALTAKLVGIQKRLRATERRDIAFIAVTVDPERDTPAVLAQYASNLEAGAGWHFLTGSQAAIQAVAEGFAVLARKQATGEVDHSFLTSLVDREGMIRLQYLGVRFSPQEFIDDLRALLKDGRTRK